jgi:hypothetical protein
MIHILKDIEILIMCLGIGYAVVWACGVLSDALQQIRRNKWQ